MRASVSTLAVGAFLFLALLVPSASAQDLCPPSTYRDGDGGACVDCPVGFSSPAGSIDISDCRSPCVAGSYFDDNGRCTTCPTGTTSLAGSVGSANCGLDCPPGQADEFGRDECRECTNFGVSAGGVSGCSYCGEGEAAFSGTFCRPCDPGSYKRSDMNFCENCGQGFTSTTGATRCDFVSCEPGFGIDTNGDGFGTLACQPCPDGSAVSMEFGQPFCVICPIGSTPAADASSCIPCAANTFGVANGDITSCAACPDGEFAGPGSIGADSCVAPAQCPASSITTGDGRCTCPFGTVQLPDLECIICEVGSAASFDNTFCELCQIDTYGELQFNFDLNKSFPTCTPCPPGKTSPEGSVGEASCVLAPTFNMGRRAALARVGACERGLTACLLTEENWECVDVDNDIQSCGGCWSDGSGEDCTLLLSEDGEGEVTCLKGVCHVTN